VAKDAKVILGRELRQWISPELVKAEEPETLPESR
jgi:hypothetical protein